MRPARLRVEHIIQKKDSIITAVFRTRCAAFQQISDSPEEALCGSIWADERTHPSETAGALALIGGPIPVEVHTAVDVATAKMHADEATPAPGSRN